MTAMYNSNRQLAYAPTPYVPRSSLSATINLDEVGYKGIPPQLLQLPP